MMNLLDAETYDDQNESQNDQETYSQSDELSVR